MVIGCIGCGNMGGALLAGLLRSAPQGSRFCAYTRTPERLAQLEAQGVRRLQNALEVAKEADLLLLCVKPAQVAAVLREIAEALTEDKVLLSVAAGISLEVLARGSGGRCCLVRCMPDTPALVGKGVFAFAFSASCSRERAETILALFRNLGLCFEMPESQFAAFSALIGAGPAYVFAMMQALCQAGVTLGFSHESSRKMVQALVEGCAVMAEKSPEHLARLKDNVCSPHGLTIDGVNVLDRRGFSGILIDAVLAANARGLAMEKEA
ncbi:MAG: pyrroline-5-carboxylate reductase [Desulfovibrio sp.]|nr:pyrroline-5-carboxylate reductase [Desulfovibrio sp.]